MDEEIFAVQNRVREDPRVLVPYLEDMLSRFDGNLLIRPGEPSLRTNEGPAAVKEAINALNSMAPMQKLKWNEDLERIARDLAEDTGPKGLTGHSSSDGTSFGDRFDGTSFLGIAENISYGADTATEVIVQLIVDDGVSSRGHRKNIFNPDYNRTGIFTGYHKIYDTMTVIDYARARETDGN